MHAGSVPGCSASVVDVNSLGVMHANPGGDVRGGNKAIEYEYLVHGQASCWVRKFAR